MTGPVTGPAASPATSPTPSPASETVRLGTRRSALAMAQAGEIADALAGLGDLAVETVGITSYGDTTGQALSQLGGQGVFVTALRERLLAGEIDIAVHSLKDLPTTPAPGLTIAAVPGREEPFDVLVARDGLRLEGLPPGARVGTGSLRRAAQLRALRPDLDVPGIRGNVDTRIGKVTSGELDGVVLARAGLARLGRLDAVTETLDPARMTPAPGQGALAVECRAERGELRALLGGLDDPAARVAVSAERALLATLEAGCSAPVGAYAEPVTGPDGGARLELRAVVASVDGTHTIRRNGRAPSGGPEELGESVAAEMLAAGAAGLIGERGSGG